MRIPIILVSLLFSASIASRSQSPTALKLPEYLTIQGKDIWVRDKPVTGKVVMKLNTGDKCMILDRGNYQVIRHRGDYWYKIGLNGQQGWVFGSQSNIKKRNDLDTMKLKGAVKSMKVKRYEMNSSGEIEISPDGVEESFVSFDESGNMLQSTDNSFVSWSTGPGTEARGLRETKFNFKYDNRGYLLELTYNDEDGINTYACQYDASGLITQGILFDPNGKQIEKHVFTYDRHGNLLEERRGVGDDPLVTDCTYLYDKGSNVIRSVYSSTGFYYRTPYNNVLGQTIEMRAFSKSETKFTWRLLFKYDSRGNLLESIREEEDGHRKVERRYMYDEQDNRIEIDWTYAGSAIKNSKKYEYDANGNWTKSISYENNKPLSTSERVLEYY